MNVILYAIALALMVLGAVELVRWFCFWAHSLGGEPEEKGQMALVVIPAGAEDCEALIRVAGERLEWMSLKPPCRFICVAPGGEAGKIADRLALRYKGLESCRLEELPEMFSKINRK